eukprot:1533103-Rhodomonas_salina.4
MPEIDHQTLAVTVQSRRSHGAVTVQSRCSHGAVTVQSRRMAATTSELECQHHDDDGQALASSSDSES